MNCEHAVTLLSARVDHEIQPDDRALLEAHLADCPACRATAEAFALQHGDLQRAFESRRAAAVVVAEKVIAQLPAAVSPRTPWMQHTGVRIGLVAGSVAASLTVLLTWLHHPPQQPIGPTPSRSDSDVVAGKREWLTPRPRPTDPAIAKLTAGATLETKPGERRRVGLPDGSVLFVNQNTRIQLDGERTVLLERGELFVEVAAHGPNDGFVVKTPDRAVTALGTKFEVRADGKQTGVVVTQGKVQVSGMDRALQAGQALTAQGVEPAPRASHLLDWTRDLMAAAESPLVPASAHEGGALVAVDANGQEAKLSLRRFTVDVHIEDGFARTTIDQTYFNQHPWRLEGTFYFPLPPDASLSRLAMYVADGSESNLMEGGMAERGHAAAVYQKIVNNQRDPALLEWVDGSTFKMRVFPLEGRQEKRILLSYTQRLAGLYGRSQYRFPAGHSLQTVREWNFRALVKGGKNLSATSPTHPLLKKEEKGGDLLLSDSAVSARVDKDVALDLASSAGTVPDQPARFVRAELDGHGYLALRYRPDLPGKAERQRRDWVFLYESSADRDPLLARTQIDVLRHLLTNAEHDDTFALLTAGTRVHAFRPEPVPATRENVAAAVQWLERTHLIGALDLGRAFRTAEPLLKLGGNPHLVHLGSGLTAIGTAQKELAALLPSGVRYVGIGVGKRWNRAWMKEQAEKTGGYFTQINPDETISWRAFDLLATLNTPRLLNVAVTAIDLADSSDGPPFLTDATTLAQGEELFAVMRINLVLKKVLVKGTLDGQEFRVELPIENVTDGAGYLPRTWAKWELDRLLLDYQYIGREETKNEIVALSKAMYVMTPFTSLLVLENEAMYEEFKVDRGRKDHWALYETKSKIPTVYEPLANEVDVRNAPRGLKPTAEQVRQTVVMREASRFVNLAMNGRPSSESFPAMGGYLPREIIMTSSGRGQGVTRERMLESAGGDVRAFDPTMIVGTTIQGTFIPNEVTLAGQIARLEPNRVYRGVDSDRVLRLDPNIIGAGIQSNIGNLFGSIQSITTSSDQPISFNGGIGGRLDGNESSSSNHFNNWSAQARFNMPLGMRVAHGKRPLDTNYTADLVIPVGNFATLPYAKREGEMAGAAANQLGYYPPAQGLAVNGTMRIRPRSGVAFSPDGVRVLSAGDIEEVIQDGIIIRRLSHDISAPSLIYDRLTFTADARLFTDLVSYAPGLNSSRADLLAVLDDEAAPNLHETPGSIDPEVIKLIDRARQAGWQTLTLSTGEGKPGVVLTFDGAGRYTYERRVSFGLHERVVCDGKTLLHVYPELGLAARRNMTRFHRAELTDLVPWSLPPAADLARGCDLEFVAPRTIALVPHGVKEQNVSTSRERERPEDTGRSRSRLVRHVQYHLLFAEDGRLAERQIVVMPEKKVLVREIYDGKGGVRVLDADGKEVFTHKRALESAQNAPDLAPDTKDLVVLPLPYRTRAHSFPAADLDPNRDLSDEMNGCQAYLDSDKVLSLLATLLAEGKADESRLLVRTHFFDKGDLRPGLFTILTASGADLRYEPALQTAVGQAASLPADSNRLAAYPTSLLRYFALGASGGYDFLLRRGPVHLAQAVAPPDMFLGRLAATRELTTRWQAAPPRWIGSLQRRTDFARTLAFIHDNRDSVLGWALLVQTQQRGSHHNREYLALAKAWEELAVSPPRKQGSPDFRAQYEQACCLADGGKREEARKLFEELYARALKAGGLPAVDARFMNALLGDAGADDRWTPLLRSTAAKFVKEKRRAAVVYLAWQCQQLKDPTLADTLLAAALDGITDDAERLIVHLAAIDYLSHTSQQDRAGALMEGLLGNDKWNEAPLLWRLAARLATERGEGERSSECLERALDLEYRELPNVIPLESWRQDYGALLTHYRALAGRTTSTKTPLDSRWRGELLARTIRAADRWRAHDPEATSACQTASEILRLLGEDELAWEYLTTPNAMQPERAASVRSVAASLSREGQHTLAEFAYEVAHDAEPSDPNIVWERAQNLRRAGRNDEAQRWLRVLVAPRKEESWEWRRVRERAEWELKRR